MSGGLLALHRVAGHRRRRVRRGRGRRPSRRRPRGRLRAAGRGDPRGLPPHYATGRVVRPEDPDLSLLAGDRLYALGLARLAELGDLAAVDELADVISLAAQAHAEGDPARAAAVWEAGARVVGDGPPRGPRGRQGRVARRLVGSPPAVYRSRLDMVSLASAPVAPQTTEAEVHRRTPDPGRLRGRDRHAQARDGARRPRRRRRSRSSRSRCPRSASRSATPCSSDRRSPGRPVGPPGRFPRRHVHPEGHHDRPGHRRGRQDDRLHPRPQPGHRRPEASGHPGRRPLHRALHALHAPRLPGALRCRPRSASSARATAASTTSRAWSTAARRCARSTASSRACENGQVEVGPRYSVNSEFKLFQDYRDPAQTLDGIGQYVYPPRFSTPKLDPVQLTMPKLPPSRRCCSPAAEAPGEVEKVKPPTMPRRPASMRPTGSTSARRCPAPCDG